MEDRHKLTKLHSELLIARFSLRPDQRGIIFVRRSHDRKAIKCNYR